MPRAPVVRPGSGDPSPDADAALRIAVERVRVDPDDLNALETVGALLLRRGQADKALEFLHRVTRADPRYPGIWELKAEAFEAVGDTQNAAACRRRGSESPP